MSDGITKAPVSWSTTAHTADDGHRPQATPSAEISSDVPDAVPRHARTIGPTIDLVAQELLEAQRDLGEITGQVSSDELLGRIFGSFCIGK